MLQQPTVTVFGKMLNMKFGVTPKGVTTLNFAVSVVDKDKGKYYLDCTAFGARAESLKWLPNVDGTIICYAFGPLQVDNYKGQAKVRMYCNELQVYVVDNDRNKFTATADDAEEKEPEDFSPPF